MIRQKRLGRIFILSAPAGTGKTTLMEMLAKEFPHVIANISYTTRPARPSEKEGIHYHFLTEAEFQMRIERGDFLEHVNLYGYQYGTSKQWIEDKVKEGKLVFLVIDTQGAMNLKSIISATYIFIAPPSLQELEVRLRRRQTETEEVLKKRLEQAKKEMEAVQYYDYSIVNKNLNTAYDILRSIVIAEEHRIR